MTAKKELKPTDPEFLPAQYDLTAARIRALRKEYDPKNIPAAKTKGDDGYQAIHEKAMAIVKVRTKIEKVRKGLTVDAVAWQKKVNTEAKRLTAEIEAIEEPWRAVKRDLDEAEAKAAEAAQAAERKRLEEIEQRIANIKDLANGLLMADATLIQERLMKAKGIVIDKEWYGDYIEAAEITLDTVITTLENAHTERLDFEKKQAELAEQEAENQRRQEELDAQQKAIDDQKAAQEAAAKAEREKQEKAEREAREEEDRLKREQEAAAQAKRESVALKKRMPEDMRLRVFADELRAVEIPEIKNTALRSLLTAASIKVTEISRDIYANTQAPAEEGNHE